MINHYLVLIIISGSKDSHLVL